MKLINKTDYDTVYLRRLIEWVRVEVGLRPDWIRKIIVKKPRTRSWTYRYDGMHGCTVGAKPGNESGLVKAIASCLGHMTQCQDGNKTYQRGPVRTKADHLVKLFNEGAWPKFGTRSLLKNEADAIYDKVGISEDDIPAENLPTVVAVKPVKVSPVEKRAKKAQLDLDRWQRKLKLAQGKVAKLKRRVAYYTQRSS